MTSDSESVEARVSFGLNLSLGGIKDTVDEAKEIAKRIAEM